jgi:hypothetical protein
VKRKLPSLESDEAAERFDTVDLSEYDLSGMEMVLRSKANDNLAEGRMPTAFKPRGSQGSWFATWHGRPYPCIHNHWRCGERRQWHDDPYAGVGIPKWDEFIAAIKAGRVIETKDVVPDDVKDGTWKRTDYIALWEIDNFEITPNIQCEGHFHLRFRFAKRLS